MFLETVKCFGDKTCDIHINNLFHWDMKKEEKSKYKGLDV